jgi:hypothetical protein
MLFIDECNGINNIATVYYTLNMIAVSFYFSLILDLAVFNNGVSAYVLMCGRMLSEMALFLFAMVCVLITLGSAFSCLDDQDDDFKSIPQGVTSLWEMILGMYSTDKYKALHESPVVLIGVYCYLVITVVFLVNLLIAQLCCSYGAIYEDMVGYARLKRNRIIVETMPIVSQKKWDAFLESLALEERIEFNEGDLGVSGGIQIMEPANANPVTSDTIRRVGGTTSPQAQWPEENTDGDDKFGKLEAMCKKAVDALAAMNQPSRSQKKAGGKASASGMSGMIGSSMGDEHSEGENIAEGEEEYM